MFNHQEPQLTVDYWLPITKVNVTGTVVTATRACTPPTTDERRTPATVSVVTRPDYNAPYQIRLDADAWANHSLKVGLLSDARLASLDATNTSGRAGAIKDILGFAGWGAGIGGVIGGPLGIVIGGAGALAIAATALGSVGVRGLTDSEGTEQPEPDYEKLNVLRCYVDEQPVAARLLADLRVAEATGRLHFAAAAAQPPGSVDLADLQRRLRQIRAELAISEAAYQQWLDSTLTTLTVSYDEEIPVASLPGPATVKAWYTGQPGQGLEAFHAACRALRIAISYEPSEGAPAANTPPRSPRAAVVTDGLVHYRCLQPAVLRVYAVTGQGQGVDLVERSTQRVLIAVPGQEKTVPLLAGKSDRSLSVAFDATGAVTSISTEVTGAALGAANALGALPAAMKDAFSAGTELGKPFSAAGRAEALKDQLAERKARADLAAGPDPLQKLKDDVEKAELEARLKVANQLATGEASAAVVVMTEP